ncbi:MAG: hypothetical protein RMN25_01370 [Anaerolineae bacterium]|nr:hypothetical protein [Thermoflexales bacterium]MDW8406405.1 hypothetical protein [Anaerolineae bacterium]
MSRRHRATGGSRYREGYTLLPTGSDCLDVIDRRGSWIGYEPPGMTDAQPDCAMNSIIFLAPLDELAALIEQ